MHEPLTNLRPVIFLQFAPGTPRTEVWRGLQGASTLRADCGKIVIAVSEDIDPTNTDAVFWSLAYRANLGEDLHVAPYRSGGHGPKSGAAPRRLDAADRRDAQEPDAAAGAAGARIHGERARHLGGARPAARSTPQPPWHGYSLGDWDARWDTFARRAVDGEWEKSGTETFARRRGGLTPETPVREVEKK